LIKLGYALSSEEHEPKKLIAHAQMAESAGFKFLIISDHFHP
jgi:coenzyme F420-dependent glucose-6-phosphate dehydrogenase